MVTIIKYLYMAQYKIRPKLSIDFKDFLTDWKVRVLEVKGALEERPKSYFQMNFAEEHGVEVYVPADRKVDKVDFVIRGMYLGSSPNTDLEEMKTFLRGNGVLHFWDTHRDLNFDLVYEGYEPEIERYRSTGTFIQFKLNFTKNINSSIDSAFLDEYTEADLEKFKNDIINATSLCYDAIDRANAVASHPPVPINGYWHNWDIVTSQYVNTYQRSVLDLEATYSNGYLTITTQV